MVEEKIPVLVVEDELVQAKKLKFYLEKNGFQVDCCKNGIEALEQLETNTYTLIFSDYQMPYMDGLELLEKVKQNDRTKGVPFIILTTADQPEILEKSLEMGAIEYLIKPFKPTDIRLRATNMAKMYQLQQILERDLENLLSNLKEGFMIFGADGIVRDGCTEVSKKFFSCNPAGKNITEVLQLSEEKTKSLNELLETIFEGMLDFYDLINFAPQRFDTMEDRCIMLEYQPIYKKDEPAKLDSIICVSADKTEEIKLKEKTERDESMAKMVISILRDIESFEVFVIETRNSLKDMQKQLQAKDVDVNMIFRGLHSIKGGAACFYILDIQQMAHRLEDQLDNARFNATPKDKASKIKRMVPFLNKGIEYIGKSLEILLNENSDFIDSIGSQASREKKIPLDEIYKMSQMIYGTIGQEKGVYQRFIDNFVQEDIAKAFFRFEDVVRTISAKLGKKIRFINNSSNIRVCMEPYLPMMNTFIHVFRNAVDHGLELPEVRQKNGKPETGTIAISFKNQFSKSALPTILIKVADDGQGLDPDKIKQIAIAKGLLSENEAMDLNDNEVIQQIFAPGFSTKETVTDLSGRGVGLDALKIEAQKLGGDAWVESLKGKGAKILVSVPIFETPQIKHKTSTAVDRLLKGL